MTDSQHANMTDVPPAAKKSNPVLVLGSIVAIVAVIGALGWYLQEKDAAPKESVSLDV